jgi:hypothetical protein
VNSLKGDLDSSEEVGRHRHECCGCAIIQVSVFMEFLEQSCCGKFVLTNTVV